MLNLRKTAEVCLENNLEVPGEKEAGVSIYREGRGQGVNKRSTRDCLIPGQSSLRNAGAKIFMRLKQGK